MICSSLQSRDTGTIESLDNSHNIQPDALQVHIAARLISVEAALPAHKQLQTWQASAGLHCCYMWAGPCSTVLPTAGLD